MFFSEVVPRDRFCPHLENGEISKHFGDMDPQSHFYCPDLSRFKQDTAELEKQNQL